MNLGGIHETWCTGNEQLEDIIVEVNDVPRVSIEVHFQHIPLE
jgi:uncharacterized membrane protein